MPTYEYLCQACSHRFETWQKMADEPLTICPECGGSIRRVLFPTGVVFKGHGFYKTDYKNGSSANGNGNGNAANNGESKKSESSESSSASSSEKAATESKSTESKPSSESKTTSVA